MEQLPDAPKQTALYAVRVKLDTVAMGIERRFFRDLCENQRHEVVSIHLYSDGSPVAGAELQGMILDIIFLDGTVMQFILLGCTCTTEGAVQSTK